MNLFSPGVAPETPAAPISAAGRLVDDRAAGPVSACASCGQATDGQQPTSGAIYAVGRLQVRFPSLGAEKEYMQLAAGDPHLPVQLADLKAALARPENRYLARRMCWIFGVAATDVCVVVPRHDSDLDELVDMLESDEADVVQALVATPSLEPPDAACAATGLPAVWPVQLLSFALEEFVRALPAPEGAEVGDPAYQRIVYRLFAQLTQRTENRGLTDEHRALNYVSLRYPPIYHLAWAEALNGRIMIGVDARPAHTAFRRVVAVRLGFRDAETHVVERHHCYVDVTDEFPFLVNPLRPTYD